jgi:hypothetical protein
MITGDPISIVPVKADARPYLIGASLATITLVAAFSPILAFYLGIAVLLAASQILDRRTVRWIGYICAYSASVSAASRLTFDISDDFTRYYQNYLDILSNGWSAVGAYGNEVGLPLIYAVLAQTGLRSPLLPLFAVTMISLTVFVVWVDKFGSLPFEPEWFGSVMAMSLLFVDFVTSTQLTRQFLSSVFVLYAISVTGWRSLAWLLIATLFHQTAVPIYILVRLVLRFRWRVVAALCALCVLLLIYFQALLTLGLGFDLSVLQAGAKILFYVGAYEDIVQGVGINIVEIRFVALNCLAALLARRQMPKGWPELMFCVAILYVMFLPFPMVSYRLFLLFGAVLTGYIFSFVSFRIGWAPVTAVGFAFVGWKVASQVMSRNTTAFALWDKFDMVGRFPFYYVLAVLR